MSSHYIYLSCEQCKVTERIYTGDADPETFANRNWEGEFIVTICDNCEGEQK